MPAAAAHSPKSAHLHAEVFGDYQVIRKIGSGGMAEIHLAYGLAGTLAGKPVALKRMHAHLADQERMRRMFLSEADIGERLHTDSVCEIFDRGAVGDTCFIAMEYLHGGPLGGLLHKLSRKQRYLKLRFLGPIVDQVCSGLHEAHAQGIVHRDVSPNNIFLTVGGSVKVLDFGVAKASFASMKTRTGIVKGTFAYMAPEQLKGQPVDERCDVFSLGVVLHEAVTCRRLFKRENDYLTCKAITGEPVPRMSRFRSGVPEGLERVVARALASDPRDRYSDVRELAEETRVALLGQGEPPSPAVLGAEVERLFASELDDIDDIVSNQPTHVKLTGGQQRVPMTAMPVRRRRSAGEVLHVLPLRAEVSVAEARFCPTETGRLPYTAPPRRRSRARGARARALLAAAFGLLLLAASSTWASPPADTGLPRPGGVSVPAEQPAPA